MFITIYSPKSALFRRIVCGFVGFALILSLAIPPSIAQLLPNLPTPGQMIGLTPAFQPSMLRGMTIHPENPLQFDFIVDRGQNKLGNEELKQESEKLIKYFLAAMTIPDKEAWVNLSPYEKDRIIPDALGQTEMGRQMLEQDYILKQISSSLTNPDKELGQKFWNEVKARAQKQFDVSQIPLSTFNKVWIVPDRATVVEKDGFAYITESYLKVMLDIDYQSTAKAVEKNDKISAISTDVFREMILPKLVEEVNTGKNFSPTRQVYQSVVLAAWYKKTLKDSLLGRIYADKSKVLGVEADDPDIKRKVYDQYIEAFKKGAYNIIKEEGGSDGDLIPRKYFSGGSIMDASSALTISTDSKQIAEVKKAILKSDALALVAASAVEANTEEGSTVIRIAEQISASSGLNFQKTIDTQFEKLFPPENDLTDSGIRSREIARNIFRVIVLHVIRGEVGIGIVTDSKKIDKMIHGMQGKEYRLDGINHRVIKMVMVNYLGYAEDSQGILRASPEMTAGIQWLWASYYSRDYSSSSSAIGEVSIASSEVKVESASSTLDEFSNFQNRVDSIVDEVSSLVEGLLNKSALTSLVRINEFNSRLASESINQGNFLQKYDKRFALYRNYQVWLKQTAFLIELAKRLISIADMLRDESTYLNRYGADNIKQLLSEFNDYVVFGDLQKKLDYDIADRLDRISDQLSSHIELNPALITEYENGAQSSSSAVREDISSLGKRVDDLLDEAVSLLEDRLKSPQIDFKERIQKLGEEIDLETTTMNFLTGQLDGQSSAITELKLTKDILRGVSAKLIIISYLIQKSSRQPQDVVIALEKMFSYAKKEFLLSIAITERLDNLVNKLRDSLTGSSTFKSMAESINAKFEELFPQNISVDARNVFAVLSWGFIYQLRSNPNRADLDYMIGSSFGVKLKLRETGITSARMSTIMTEELGYTVIDSRYKAPAKVLQAMQVLSRQFHGSSRSSSSVTFNMPLVENTGINLNTGSGDSSDIYVANWNVRQVAVKVDRKGRSPEADAKVLLDLLPYGGPEYYGMVRIKVGTEERVGVAMEIMDGIDIGTLVTRKGKPLFLISDAHVRAIKALKIKLQNNGKMFDDIQWGDFILTPGGQVRPVDMEVINQVSRNTGESESFDIIIRWLEQNRSRINAENTSLTQSAGSSSVTTPVGGIDFDPSKLNLQIKRDGHGVPLPLIQQDLMNIDIKGLQPIIIKIQPINLETLPVLGRLN